MDRSLSRALFCSLLLVPALSSVALAAAAPLPNSQPVAGHADTQAGADPRLQGGYKFNEGGWTYVHLEGTPEQVGFQHGYLLAREIEDNVHVYTVTAPHEDKRPWSFFRQAGKTVLWPHIDPEYQEELKGIAAGLKAQGSSLDLWDIVALNGDIELSNYYLPTVNKKEHRANPEAAVAPASAAPSSPPARPPRMARS